MTDKHFRVKARFLAEGVTVKEWAQAHGFNVRLAYRVLQGEIKGTSGEGHKIAVALGLKKEPKKLILRPMLDAA